MQIAELKFGDVGRGLSHYKPVVAAVAVIAVMGLTLPGPKFVLGGGRFDADAFDAANTIATPAAAGVTGQSAEVASAVEAIEASPSDFSSTFSTPAPTSSSFSVDASASREAAEDSFSTSSSESATFDSSTPATTTPRAAAAQPLHIVTAAWASAQAGTPVAATGVPEGALPVGRRPGFAQDKVSFVRLAGTATSLKLLPHTDATGQRSAESAQIQACRITSPGWSEAQAQAMADAPTWDCGVAVQGVRAGDGSWTFDLTVFPDRAGANGFALVPVGDALDYQVAFTIA